MAGIQYSIKKNLLKRAQFEGMELTEEGKVVLTNGAGMHFMMLPALNSGIVDCAWGRLNYTLQLPEDSVCYLYLFASNEEEAGETFTQMGAGMINKKQQLADMGAIYFLNKTDVLLYQLTGQYLWIGMEIIGENGSIENIRVQAPGDVFMQMFPEVYREKNSFFHRYLSVFSSLYDDFQEKLDHREELLDIDEAPAALLETLRNLLKNAGWLIRHKGTRQSIEKICELLLDETPVIVERSRLNPYIKRQDIEVYNTLYGDSPYDVTLLVSTYVEERKKEQLLHLLRQFKPVRSRLHIVFLEQSGVLDAHSYMDRNAVTFMQSEGMLDAAQFADGTVILQ